MMQKVRIWEKVLGCGYKRNYCFSNKHAFLCYAINNIRIDVSKLPNFSLSLEDIPPLTLV
jgi:hypothetical protein